MYLYKQPNCIVKEILIRDNVICNIIYQYKLIFCCHATVNRVEGYPVWAGVPSEALLGGGATLRGQAFLAKYS